MRLGQLFAKTFEETPAAFPVRPVPRYFFYAGDPPTDPPVGKASPGDELSMSGVMTVYDSAGMPIDPLAVATAFQALMTTHDILSSEPQQLDGVVNLAGTPAVHMRLCDHASQPYPNHGEHLQGISPIAQPIGVFTLDAASGTGSDLSGSITKEASTGASGSFPDEVARLLVLGPATTGRLGDDFSPPALPPGSGISLRRDFFNLRVVDLKSYLLGTPDPGFAGTLKELPPTVHIHEPLSLLADGNDVLAAANAALSNTPDEALCVAQAIAGDFAVPIEPDNEAHWPQFPSPNNGTETGPLPVNLRDDFAATAQWFDDGDTDIANVDVVLSLSGLPVDAAVRVYPRKFVEDAREARGDGAGGVVPPGASPNGSLSLRLPDPLGLRRPGMDEDEIVVPDPATLRCDVLIVRRSGESRLYGNVETHIEGPTTDDPTAIASNPFESADRRSVSNAGVLGQSGQPDLVQLVGSNQGLEAQLIVLNALSESGTPRKGPRLPTMARRDLLVAGLSGGNWHSVIAGGRLTPEAHSADPRQGSPGSLGGRETQLVGVSTQNGRLAYDIGRMALRRTTDFVSRMANTVLAGDDWAVPNALTAQSGSAGTFAGAVLQTIAPSCETPEFYLLRDAIESDEDLSDIPPGYNALVDWVQLAIAIGTPSLPNTDAIQAAISRLNGEITSTLDGLKGDDSSPSLKRLYEELRREVAASCFGRRDTQWALANAIGNARHCIYIESPGFLPTQGSYAPDPTPPYALDLIELLATRLDQAHGLHVIICTPKHPDYASPDYDKFAEQEIALRRDRILVLPSERVVAFHPIGFPGRPSRLESTVVVVDDLWALVGSSTFRRRGLTFDGSSDIVFTDFELEDGRSPAIMSFRRQLMASRLGIKASDSNDFGVMPGPDFVRLRDGVEAFQVVREMLLPGGLGKIARLWNGRVPGTAPPDPGVIAMDLANPEGLEFDLAETLALHGLIGLQAF
jgi:hypothetical protein